MTILRKSCVALALLWVSGCASTPPAEVNAANLRDHVAVGDRVGIVAADGATYDIEVTAIQAQALRGVSAGKEYTINFDEIRTIEPARVHGEKGAGIGSGSVVMGVAFSVLIVLALVAL